MPDDDPTQMLLTNHWHHLLAHDDLFCSGVIQWIKQLGVVT